MLAAAKSSLVLLLKSSMLNWEMLIRTSQPTLLQRFCKILLNSQVIVKSVKDPDDNFWSKLYCKLPEFDAAALFSPVLAPGIATPS